MFPRDGAGGVYDFWKLPLAHLTLGAQRFALSPSKLSSAANPVAVLDSGTTLVLGPSADVARLYAALGPDAAQWVADPGQWEVRCNRSVSVSFALGNARTGSLREYLVHPLDFAWGEERAADGWCTGGIQENDGVREPLSRLFTRP